MKRYHLLTTAAIVGLGLTYGLSLAGTSPTEARKDLLRVGVYDSRTVALAHYHRMISQGVTDEFHKDHAKAKEAGDAEAMQAIEAKAVALQQQMHNRVFGHVPVDDILDEAGIDLAVIAREAGVDLIVCQWDIGYQHPDAELIDLSKPLVLQFEPSEETLKTIESLKNHPPVPLDQIKHDH